MSQFNKPVMAPNSSNEKLFKLASEVLIDKSKVRLGGLAPAFRMISIKDEGKVRLGGLGPIFR